ncbi:MAG: hypothetical protein ACKO37_10315 [Vampirovibrionales bacterium]
MTSHTPIPVKLIVSSDTDMMMPTMPHPKPMVDPTDASSLSAFMTPVQSILGTSERDKTLSAWGNNEHPAVKLAHQATIFSIKLTVLLARSFMWSVMRLVDGIWLIMQWLKKQWHEQTQGIPIPETLLLTPMATVQASSTVVEPPPAFHTLKRYTQDTTPTPTTSHPLAEPPAMAPSIIIPSQDPATEALRQWVHHQEQQKNPIRQARSSTPSSFTETRETRNNPAKTLQTLADSIEALL